MLNVTAQGGVFVRGGPNVVATGSYKCTESSVHLHRVTDDDLAAQVEAGQQFGGCGDLVLLVSDGNLHQHYALSGHIGGRLVDALALPGGNHPTHGFAVERNKHTQPVANC